MRRKSMMLGGLATIASVLVLAGSPTLAQMNRGGMQGPTTDQTMQGPNSGSMQGPAQETAPGQNMQSGQPLNTVSNPSSALASAMVQDATGQPVGQVKTVHTSSAGTARSVAVSLTSGDNSGKVVTIKADKLMFDPSSNVLKSSLTLQEIDQLPTTQSP